jgi:hypothetical protein
MSKWVLTKRTVGNEIIVKTVEAETLRDLAGEMLEFIDMDINQLVGVQRAVKVNG